MGPDAAHEACAERINKLSQAGILPSKTSRLLNLPQRVLDVNSDTTDFGNHI
jgi:hypothetical protein